MTRLALPLTAFALLASVWALWPDPAWPQSQRSGDLVGQAAIGSIVIVNHTTAKVDEYRTHAVAGVNVTVHYQSTVNGPDLDSRDIVTITAPDGYMAIPSDVLLPEGESVEVMIYEAVVG